MTKAFNDREKELIKTKLMHKGKELFGIYGIKKTSIGNLTRAAGIAQGSFYSFFGSKEELYFEIMEQEHQQLQENLFKDGTLFVNLTREGLKGFILTAFEAVDSNALLKRLMMEDEYELIVRKLPEEKLQKHIQQDTDNLLPMVEHWQAQGRMIKKDPKLVASMFRALFTVMLHKKEIGEEDFKGTMELLVELVVNSLIIEGGEKIDRG